MIGLDLLGAGAGLSTQTVMVRVREIDPEKLRASLAKASPCAKCGAAPDAPVWGTLLSPALAIVDQFPKKAIDLAIPIVKRQLAGLGVIADLAATDSPPPPRPPAETGVALALGAVLGGALALVIRRLVAGGSR